VSYLGRLADLLANDFPLIIFVLFNGIQQRLALMEGEVSMVACLTGRVDICYLVLGKLSIVHVLSSG
jgi:hypothetical protein